MEFYQSLAKYYDEIFPLKKAQETFIRNYLKQEALNSVLDVGCGTGSLATVLAQGGIAAHGVDLSTEMIEIARKKAQAVGSPAMFSVADMRNLSGMEVEFDGIVCLGNTLAHVSGETELKQVLTQFRLKAAHVLVQTVNYDRIIAKQIKELPVIKTPSLTFQRFYTFCSDGGLDFTTKILFSDSGEEVSGVNRLYPVTCSELRKAFEETGWKMTEQWGNFEKEPWTPDSPATILAAKSVDA
ncbi:class I SAM-dependent methyltransferase [Desulfosporosinus sp. PR]|uniref:class I SAM-dependent methyltransferase n=1 Tax=Candidatus Desulfosporosinus nitrosoreducens TaxID=3401928 RepID=UPI0027ED5160|nr:class I SAM-dependent methyltransferase [Desulfosporosinus sp. PR]MDQ7094980.1 class I SAM-dependent methyltransferase [Desulfosporosinus sp. PR]